MRNNLHRVMVVVLLLIGAGNTAVRGQDQDDGETSTLHVEKYEDRNANGRKERSEPGLNGWEITVLTPDGMEVASAVTEDDPDTGEPGWAWFELEPGEYEICETLQDGWTNTDPGSDVDPCKDVEVEEPDDGSTSVILSPGNEGSRYEVELLERDGRTWTYRVTELAGRDLGHWNLGLEACLGHITDTDPNAEVGFDGSTDLVGVKWDVGGGFSSGEFSVTLDEVYPATEVPVLVFAGGDVASDEILGPDCDSEIEPVRFGNARENEDNTLHVQKYEDRNRNGRQDSDEPGLNGWTIVVFDEEGDEVASGATAGHPETDEAGWVWFEDLPAGEYLVCEELQDGFANTDPGDGSLCKLVTLGGVEVDGGGPTSIELSLGDGMGTTFEIELIDVVDTTWTYRVTELAGKDLSHWNLGIESCLGHIVDVSPDGEVGRDGSTDFVGVKWDRGAGFRSGEFSITLDDEYPATTVLALAFAGGDWSTGEIAGPDCDAEPGTTEPAELRFGNAPALGSLHVQKYEDLDQDGQRDEDEPGLNGWVIVVFDDSGEPVASDETHTDPVTGERGWVWLDLPLGDYTVCEQPQDGWLNTDPADGSFCKEVTIDSTALDTAGPTNVILSFPGQTEVGVELVSHVGASWTYRVVEPEGHLTFWGLGIESCLPHLVDVDPPESADSGTFFDGLGWEVGADFQQGDFTFTLDADFPATNVDLLADVEGAAAAALILGPDCDAEPAMAEELRFGNVRTDVSGGDATHAIVLLDRSAEMLAERATGNIRCSDALAVAMLDVQLFFILNPEATGASLAVWTSSGDGPDNLTGGFVDQATALAALAALDPEGCDGPSPLADSLCEASDALVDAFPDSSPGNRILAVSSAGIEDNSSGECSGPDSISSVPPFDPGSWQQNVLDKLIDQGVVQVRLWNALKSARSKLLAGPKGAPEPDTGLFEALASSSGGSLSRVEDSDTAQPQPFFDAGCTPTTTSLCLNGGRFRVEVEWVLADGRSGRGIARSLTDDTGYFWFFSESNVELIVKALDGRAINGNFWIFYGALSNVEYTLKVTDTRTGKVKRYRNPRGRFASRGDTQAFPP